MASAAPAVAFCSASQAELHRRNRNNNSYELRNLHSLLRSHITNSLPSAAISLFANSTVFPSPFTFPLLFKAAAAALDLSCGAQLHALAAKLDNIPATNRFIGAAIVDMYMKNGSTSDARRMFDGMFERDDVAWNALLNGYAKNGEAEEVLNVFKKMLSEKAQVGDGAIVSVILACSQLGFLHQGKWIHSWMIKSGFTADVVIATSLLDMYANCGDLILADQIFKQMHTKDLIAWNCLISLNSKYGMIEDVFELFVEMQQSGLKPNSSSLASILPSVARSGMLNLGKSCHGYVVRNHLVSDDIVITALLDVYAKLGCLTSADRLFQGMPTKGVVSWSAMIAGYGSHGCATKALALFEEMLANNIKPNHITYIEVLSACAHAGFLDEGRKHFQNMVQDREILPTSQHYTCMVDLLGRAGLFDEALELINSMSTEATAGIWGALLGSCRIHGKVDLASYAAKKLFELNPSDPGFYVLLSNIYASAGMWAQVRQVRNHMREKGLRKPAGWSSIEIGSKLHNFVSGDKTHKDCFRIYEKLEKLIEEAGEFGYVPKTKVVLHDLEDDIKQSVVKSHSEKLAMAYGLLMTSSGTPIRIMKNLRTCEDCHAFAKSLSKLTTRSIILRDAVRFHHIQNGACTCKDYW